MSELCGHGDPCPCKQDSKHEIATLRQQGQQLREILMEAKSCLAFLSGYVREQDKALADRTWNVVNQIEAALTEGG